MTENTKIEWADHTFNPWLGCTKVSPACDHCYAEAMMDTRLGRVEWGGDRKRTSDSYWREPLKWNAKAEKAGKVATVFCLSLGDIWDNALECVQWRRELFVLMGRTPWLVWLLLSKRIGNAIRMCDPEDCKPLLPMNCALGATLPNQEEWDRDIRKLREAGRVLGALFTFASVEPMLGPIDTRGDLPGWVICGGESGRGARVMNPEWAQSLRRQCAYTGVPFFMKQMGGVRDKRGQLADLPDDMRVREFPEAIQP